MDNKSISHTRWKCQYHIVFIPQYRKKVLYGKVREDVREILNTLCKYKNVEIIAGAVCVDHVHLSVAIPPKLSVSDFMGYLKGKSTLMLYDRHSELQSKLNYSHVEYVINCLGKNTTKMRNIKSYLLASLFNAGSTISSYYRAEINHDMPQYAG